MNKGFSDKKLLELAHEAKENSMAQFSGYRVGAALMTPEGKVFTGCNVENYSLSLSICAERVALFKALSEGERTFSKIAVVSDDEKSCTPCGTCRQVLYEFAPNIDVIMEERGASPSVVSIDELLPYPFRP